MHTADAKLTHMLMKLFSHSKEAIFFTNQQGKILAMNPAAEQIIEPNWIEELYEQEAQNVCQLCRGYTNEVELMSCINCFLHHPEEDFSSFQVFLKTKDKGVIPYAASYHIIDEIEGVRAFMLRDLTKQFKTQEKLYQTNMLKYVIKAQEDERKRISRELHDSVAQELLSLLVDMRLIKYMNADEEVLNKIQQTEVSLTRLLDDIRHLSLELRPASLDDLGLEAAFRSHFKWIEKNYGLLVHFSAELSAARYSSEIETVVYRVCQEAVLNALKYAGTDEVYVRLFEDQGCLQLMVKDDGIGFDLNDIEIKGTGLGLYGMHERAELVNGQLKMESKSGKGTTVHLLVPLPVEDD
ncbi:sensor histidine kinase [Paenibacillus sp. 1001270B_150601_E10]|uniref:sensor histidine kinase n=1 Tax=Paenibacillus sp. 1001270B_150601_E10 TaxID=2787079 RepID=UPI00189DE65C|nr:sensor histidine kinase [Paenibacillus sp. 1001270B_150601_E10]